MWHVWERRRVHTWLQWEHVKEIDHFEELGVNGMIIRVINVMIQQQISKVPFVYGLIWGTQFCQFH
jgi:hypothetical protein